MAEDDQGQEKTEQPSPKRLKEAREKGQVVRSKDFNAALILLMSGGSLLFFSSYLYEQLAGIMRKAFSFNSIELKSMWIQLTTLANLFHKGLFAVLPLLGAIFILSLVAPLFIGGWVFSSESIQPQFSRLNPLKGVKRIFSLKGVVEMVKSLLKFLLVATTALMIWQWQLPTMIKLASAPVEVAISTGLEQVVLAFLFISASLILIVVLDVPFQWYEHQKQLKMTRQEMKDEYKETEGKPEVKSYIRRAQQEIARRRMMAEVPKADVVLTNPTHYAVALKYQQKGNKAPVLIAKGKDLIALQINQVALAHKVPLLTLPPLTRAIYFSTKLDSEIPRGLYVAVAQVLAYIFHLKNKDYYERQPRVLRDLPIPADLQHPEEKEE